MHPSLPPKRRGDTARPCVLKSRLLSASGVVKMIILISSRWVKWYIIAEVNINYIFCSDPTDAETLSDSPWKDLCTFMHSSLNSCINDWIWPTWQQYCSVSNWPGYCSVVLFCPIQKFSHNTASIFAAKTWLQCAWKDLKLPCIKVQFCLCRNNAIKLYLWIRLLLVNGTSSLFPVGRLYCANSAPDQTLF